MSFEFPTVSHSLRSSQSYLSAKKDLLTVIQSASARVYGVKPGAASAEIREMYKQVLQEFSKDRGRDLYYPFMGSGLGSGPFVELLDGSVKFDMITGIGINFFGHTHPTLMEELVDGVSGDVMQGNLEPGVEMRDLLKAILSKAPFRKVSFVRTHQRPGPS